MKLRTFYRFFYLAVVMAAFGMSTISSAQATPDPMMMGGVGLTVFVEPNFRGSAQTFQQNMSNLANTGFNDRISSLRVGPGERWEVCEHANFAGRCVVVMNEEADLRRNNWDNIISSFRRVGGGTPVPPPTVGFIVFFDRTNFRGNSNSFDRPSSTLGNMNGRAQSATISGGPWQVCSGVNFTGRCITLNDSTRNLATRGMSNRISSARPISAIPPPTPNPYVVLFTEPNFRGTPTNISRNSPNVNLRTGSVTVGSGVWELCDATNYGGRCVTLSQSTSNLGSFPINSTIRSVRLVR